MDPYTATREQFTNHLLEGPIPDGATDEWEEYATYLKELLRKLAFHEAMAPNLQQTYMTPANSKNKIYFMWDFVGRTLGMLYQISPTASFADDKEKWEDVVGRSAMGAQLLLDSESGTLDRMVEMTYPAQPYGRPVIGDDVLAAARKLTFRND